MRQTSAATSQFNADPRSVGSDTTPDLPRGNGVAELIFEAKGGRTQVRHLYQEAPCRVLFPRTYRGELITGVLLTTSGGLTGGDRVRIQLSTGAHAKGMVTSQAAEKIYRSTAAPCVIDTDIETEPGSWLEWMPQETILFDRSRLRRSTSITAHAGSEIIAGDMVTLGRLAHGEVFARGSLRDGWKVSYDGRVAWLDRLVLHDTPKPSLQHAAGFDGSRAMATFLYIGDKADSHVAAARGLLRHSPIRCGVTCVNNVLIARFLAAEPQVLRVEYSRFWSRFRAAVKGLPARVPTVWEC